MGASTVLMVADPTERLIRFSFAPACAPFDRTLGRGLFAGSRYLIRAKAWAKVQVPD